MTSIKQLSGITDREARQLQALNLTTTDELWTRAGQDFGQGLDRLAQQSGIDGDRLRELLRTHAGRISDLHQLKELTRLEIHALWALHIPTIDRLWERIGQDFDGGIDRLAQQSGIDRARLIEVLARQGVREAEQPSMAFGPRIVPWVVAGLLLVGVLALVVRALLPAATPGGTVVVRAEAGLPAYQVIQAGDVALDPAQTGGEFRAPADVVGRYPLQPLAPNTPLRADQISQITLPPDALTGRTLLTVPLPDAALAATLPPGGRATLRLAPRPAAPPGAALVLSDVLIVQPLPQSAPPSAVVAVKTDDPAALIAALAAAEITLLPTTP